MHWKQLHSYQVDGLTAEVLNNHYANISTDCDYRAPKSKLTAVGQTSFITEIDIFRILDTLRPTATGLDGIPAWFLRVGAPVFAAPLAQLFNQSLAEGAVPSQWRTAVITLIPKTPKPTQAAEYRPISITPVLSRSLEKYIVRTFIYPALQQPYAELCFNDQFAFRPTGSTTAAIIALSGSYMWNKTEIKQNLFQVCFRRDCFISVLFQRLLHVKRNAETNRK